MKACAVVKTAKAVARRQRTSQFNSIMTQLAYFVFTIFFKKSNTLWGMNAIKPEVNFAFFDINDHPNKAKSRKFCNPGLPTLLKPQIQLIVNGP